MTRNPYRSFLLGLVITTIVLGIILLIAGNVQANALRTSLFDSSGPDGIGLMIAGAGLGVVGLSGLFHWLALAARQWNPSEPS